MMAVLAGHYWRRKWVNKKKKKSSTCIVLWYNALFSFSLLELSIEGAWHRFVCPECISPPAVLLRSSAVGTGLNCLILDRLLAKLWTLNSGELWGWGCVREWTGAPEPALWAAPCWLSIREEAWHVCSYDAMLRENDFHKTVHSPSTFQEPIDCAKQSRHLVNKNPLW